MSKQRPPQIKQISYMGGKANIGTSSVVNEEKSDGLSGHGKNDTVFINYGEETRRKLELHEA
jgi:hypothetical protein